VSLADCLSNKLQNCLQVLLNSWIMSSRRQRLKFRNKLRNLGLIENRIASRVNKSLTREFLRIKRRQESHHEKTRIWQIC
jgi:hypothetical protein